MKKFIFSLCFFTWAFPAFSRSRYLDVSDFVKAGAIGSVISWSPNFPKSWESSDLIKASGIALAVSSTPSLFQSWTTTDLLKASSLALALSRGSSFFESWDVSNFLKVGTAFLTFSWVLKILFSTKSWPRLKILDNSCSPVKISIFKDNFDFSLSKRGKNYTMKNLDGIKIYKVDGLLTFDPNIIAFIDKEASKCEKKVWTIKTDKIYADSMKKIQEIKKNFEKAFKSIF